MKERPILMSTPMVRATLDGSKSITRRIMKPQIKCMHYTFAEAEWRNEPTKWVIDQIYGDGTEWFCSLCGNGVTMTRNGIRCPYGKVGDILWVRETFAPWDDNNHYAYKADGFIERYGAWERDTPKKFHDVERIEKWKPGIFMPRSACRIFLEITAIRVERLQDISEEDAEAEGIEFMNTQVGRMYKDYVADPSGYGDPKHDFPSVGWPIESFKTLWESINGPGSWEINPWVWVIEFKKVDHGRK